MNSFRSAGQGRNEPCFCGSGLSFKRCCGLAATDRKPPYGVVIIEDFLDRTTAEGLTAFANTRAGERLTVVDVTQTTSDNVVRMFDDRRVTEKVDLGDEQAALNGMLRRAVEDILEPSVGSPMEWFEKPQLLRYRPGGLYAAHADSENYDPIRDTWSRILDRDFSILLYLNDDFTGGSLRFVTFHYELRPKPGMLVFFPSDRRYLHSAEPVTSGVRYAAVTWVSLSGVPKIHRRPPPDAILLDPVPRAGRRGGC